ncbi:hypothetical protein QT342_05060 [Escherichia coli]|uniref:hypothetical protein n=1 Tax=Escherichia coli TaxID=562 RepID=UPI00259CA17F|nr:hypothetical protein [Escherichia coli]MDM4885914.1 hypothetical protein [Escherichia coli]
MKYKWNGAVFSSEKYPIHRKGLDNIGNSQDLRGEFIQEVGDKWLGIDFGQNRHSAENDAIQNIVGSV